MIRSIIRFSAHNRALVLIAVAVAVAYGVYTLQHIPLDAIPDLSDTQVIVYSRWDRSPDIIEDQVTYPIVTALLGAPNVKAIRGFSDFGFSLRLRDLRGRHRHLLGAQPRARVPVQDPAASSPRASRRSSGPTPPASAGCSSTPWSTTRARTSLGGAPLASRTGICATACSRCPAWPRWRRSAGSSSSTRSRSIPTG